MVDGAGTLRNKLIVRTLLSTGVRASELCALTVADAMDANGPRDNIRLTVHKNMTRHSGPQYVPMPASLGIALALYAGNRSPDAPLFPSNKGGHLTRRGLHHLLRRICERAQVEWKGIHGCRHTYATRLIDAGTPLQTVTACMRHSNVAVTSRYLHSTPQAMASAAAAVEV
jgi:integrase/recombinase XerD